MAQDSSRKERDPPTTSFFMICRHELPSVMLLESCEAYWGKLNHNQTINAKGFSLSAGPQIELVLDARNRDGSMLEGLTIAPGRHKWLKYIPVSNNRINMHIILSTLISLGFSILAAASDDDVVSFPAIGEVDIVFPREDTYAVEAPFPVIFGLQNAPVLTTFSGTLNWELDCAYTLFGIGRLYLDFLPDTEPYYFLNTSQAIADADEDQFQYWRGEEDSCILKWGFRWTTICEPRSDGSVLLKNNQFQRSGNKAIAEYEGCAIGGTAIKLEKNHTVGCPILAQDSSPKPKPCEIDVKKARSSLAAAVVKPTTSLTEIPSKTTDSGARTTGTGADNASKPTSTSGKSDGGDTSADSENVARGHSVSNNGGFLTVFVALSVGTIPSLFL
ncbi:hypothetical protein HYE67_009815 [Fusarium culmorum]|uniref:DUF7136 domain-containing protein n=1 Tax=Fusarium culmorum TaxID=5516 RepID=A0A7S8I0S3_FUSCU|nr:hypothetical protein HYE67_009815 [Fusarium culmorum]